MNPKKEENKEETAILYPILAGPRGFEPLFFGFLPQKRPEACAPSKEDSTP